MPIPPLTPESEHRVRSVSWACHQLGGGDVVLLHLCQMYDAIDAAGRTVSGVDLVHWYLGAGVDLWDGTPSGVVVA